MRSTRFIAAFAAVLALFSACRQDEDYLLPAIEVETGTVEFISGSQMSVELLSTRDWMVKSKPDWVAVDPDHGKASSAPQRVTFTVLPNESYDRKGTVVFSIGLKPDSPVELFQPGAKGAKSEGTGTLEDPYTIAGVLEYIGTLGADVESPQDVYIKGKIASIGEYYSAQYGNASFQIKDEDGDVLFQVYRAKYLGNRGWKTGDTQIAEGDEVIVCGRVVNFKGNTPETAANKAFLYSLNGKSEGGGSGGGGEGTPSGSGTQADPYNVAGARAAVADLTWTSNDDYQTTDDVYVKGVISRIADNGTFGQSGTYGNASFYIKDADADAEFYAFRILYLGNKKYTSGTDIKVGDEVVICGQLMNYRGNTPETVAGKAYLYSLNSESGGGGGGEGGGSGTASGTGTQADPYNVAGARAAVANLTWTSNDDYQSTDEVYVKGKISKIADNGTFAQSGTYGNASFYIKDDGADAEFYAFRILYLGNKKYESGTDIKVGDEVVICGKLMNYRGNTPETVAGKAYLYSLNGTSEGGSGGGEGGEGGGGESGTASGKGTLADPYNVAGARAAVANLTWTSNDDYQSTDEVYVKGKISKIADNGTFAQSGTYGNASFYIKDEGADDEFYAFRILYLGNKKYESGTDIKVGDEVVICGKLMNYRGNTPETVAGKAYLYSLNGTSEGGSGGSDGGGSEGGDGSGAGTPSGSGTLESPYNAAAAVNAVKDLTWTSNTEYETTEEVYVKGKICEIANKGTYGESGTYGNATFFISDDGSTTGTKFQVYRALYLGNKKYESGTDIKVGDVVIIKGQLMNYRGDTPETVSGKAYLYSLNGKTE